MKATAKELRTDARRILEAVERGQEVIITRRGEPRARLIPMRGAGAARPDARKLPAFGMWKDRDDIGDVAAYVRRLRRGRR